MRNPVTRMALLTGALLALAPLAAGATHHEKAEAAPASETDTAPELEPLPDIERQPWDADKMTTLTGDLARAVRDVRRSWRKDPAFRNPDIPNRRATLQFDQNLRELDQRTTQLHNRVKAGDGYDETLNIARNIDVLLTDLDMWGRRIMTGKWMQDRVRPAMALVNEIAAYYGSDALYDMENLQRTDRPPQNQ